MNIIESITADSQFISLEYFPPKTRQDWPAFFQTVQRLARLNPLFASVTYGAGGSTNADTLDIVTRLQQEHGLETMAHLTCIGAKIEEVAQFLDDLTAAGVSNVLALRGDLPQDGTVATPLPSPLRYASDLVSMIRSSFPGMGIGVAGYPEVHPEAENVESDLAFLKMKLDRGADFAITQLFFDNELYHSFVKRARTAGVSKPIIPGILPVVSLKVIKRIVSLCGATIPADFLAKLEQADRDGGAAAVQKIGVAHARQQAQELLASGVPGVHIYTLNRAEVVLELVEGLEMK
ncbi:MAG: methylenetetrahydrofolate reductase [NAD(P)H] [Desulfuromonadaceae bacterium]|nr:methylenetetrahydrofolate reductase [NAD(P)H] [Desulfuromonadaceae bacterium]MDD5106419.1 methylenetetrahydrofolate reductase [NAD(P)H] [Desulfuromonadaceae bacterium]